MNFMILNMLLFVISLFILYFGAKWIVHGSSNIALFLGIRPMIVGLTIVSIGTSLPEFVVSAAAVIHKSQDIALGNIIGSNIANIGLVLGLSAIVKPLNIERSTVQKEIPIMIFSSLALYFFALDLEISFMDGFILFLGLVLFIVYCIYDSKRNKKSSIIVTQNVGTSFPDKHTISFEFLLTLAGIIGIVVGAKIMVDSAVILARALGMSELFIGMTIVAVGTSLPELATSIVAARQNKDEISVGNVIGSNIFNIFMVIGIISMISPFTVESLTLKREFLIMLFFSIILFPLALHRMILTRAKGIFFLAGYVGFVWFTI